MTFASLTQEQLDALRVLVARHGKNSWRRVLQISWERATASPPLQQLRNTHGPLWLSRVRFRQIVQ